MQNILAYWQPMVVTFVTRRGRDIVLSHAKNLKSTPFAVTEQFPPSVREKHAAQIPSLIQLRKEAKSSGTESNIRLIRDKLLVDQKVITDSFQSNPLDSSVSNSEPVDFKNMIHSSVISEKGSMFQGHVHVIFSLEQGTQSLTAIVQYPVFSKSDHILYAYEFTDGDGEQIAGYCDDG